ncbi:MAG: tRNA (guanosine(37)-N1)-methyltransferase TrmD [Tissierellia bacterium]|nr:tRNA (guanosine(37)-N1)-methyltransferase TrmD [Tissierellia bacterium]
MKFTVLTLFPEFVASFKNYSIMGKAVEKGLIHLNTVDIRSYARNKHHNVDDYVYGGGPGMVIQAQPVVEAIEKNRGWSGRVIYLSPRGKTLNQQKVEELAREEHLVLLNGHYEGIDERAMAYVDEEISIGDYVLSGGEVASLVLMDAVARYVPGVLGNEGSTEEESHASGLLEHPQYTRPYDFRGYKVPEILLSGNHKLIQEYRRRESLRVTYERRPDLLEEAALSKKERQYLDSLRDQEA